MGIKELGEVMVFGLGMGFGVGVEIIFDFSVGFGCGVGVGVNIVGLEIWGFGIFGFGILGLKIFGLSNVDINIIGCLGGCGVYFFGLGFNVMFRIVIFLVLLVFVVFLFFLFFLGLFLIILLLFVLFVNILVLVVIDIFVICCFVVVVCLNLGILGFFVLRSVGVGVELRGIVNCEFWFVVLVLGLGYNSCLGKLRLVVIFCGIDVFFFLYVILFMLIFLWFFLVKDRGIRVILLICEVLLGGLFVVYCFECLIWVLS